MKHYAFIDEWGNSGLDLTKDGTSSHFIITSVIVSQTNLDALKANIATIKTQFFQGSEIKSSQVAKNDGRRMQILTALINMNFHFYSIIIDKSKLISEGFSYKQSYYKFLNGLIYEELYKSFPDLSIDVDEHGSSEFKKSLIDYVKKKYIPVDLFHSSEFKITDSKSSELIQLADFIGGTLGRALTIGFQDEQSKAFMALLSSKEISIKEWPENTQNTYIDTSNITDNKNPVIIELSLSLINKFINDNESKRNPIISDQVHFIKYLQYHYKYVSSATYISTKEIIYHLQKTSKRKVDVYYFRTQIVGALRDNDVLIASSKKGYKIPSTLEDIYLFLNHDNSIIQPMLRRIKSFRDRLLLASKNELDILDNDSESCKALKAFFENT